MSYAKPTEIAVLLRVTENTVRRLIRSGKLPGTRIGGSYRVEREALERFLKGNQSESN